MKDIQYRDAARRFAEFWKDKGYEKGESQPFWMSLLRDVLGVEYPSDFISFEDQVKIDNTSFIDGYIRSTKVLIEQKSIDKDLRRPIKQSDGSLLSPFQQAKRYSAELPYSERPRWIVTCNFKEFHIYDMEKPNGEPESVLLSELENEYYRMFFLVDQGDKNIQKQMEVSLQAGELVGILYDALLKQYNNPEDREVLKDLNILCVRLVFCFYAEDAGLFGRQGMFHDYLYKYKDNNFRDALIKLFKILDQKPEERDPYIEDDLAAFPYVNGGLFENEHVTIPRINDEIIDIILNQASANFDWSSISPTIFGAVFESTLNPESRRSGGMHYTSIENIHKVIDPLFMNELREELEEIRSIKVVKTRNRKLEDFQSKLASLTFLDPAAGSGNFLTETYISLRKLENEAIKLRMGLQIAWIDVYNPIKVSINQFYGIEINDFAVTVAKTALWIAESQMMKATEDIVHANIEFLPLESYATIVEGNALRVDWNDVIDSKKLNYIMGNPPFVGARLMNEDQKEDVKYLFSEVKGVGNLDYVSCWYKRAATYIEDNPIRCAFVSTNSITQGEQVALLWKNLQNKHNININFAYRSFVWNSEANSKAHVHCVIIGFSKVKNLNKVIWNSESQFNRAININAYLLDAPNVFIEGRRTPLCDVPNMIFGNMPNDGGHLILSTDERNELIKSAPTAEGLIRPFLGSREFINKIERWCLWLNSSDLSDIAKIKPIMERINKVREHRIASNRKSTRELSKYPYAFGEIRQPDKDYLLVPAVSSENRKYIPIGYVEAKTIASNAVLIIPDASIYNFAIMCSNVHMSWMRVVAGRLKSDYRYSATYVYNNFPWPKFTENMANKITKTGQAILDARKLYPNSSLSDLYDELIMPPELRKAHQENDKAIMEAYGFNWRTMTESECVAELMRLYQRYVED